MWKLLLVGFAKFTKKINDGVVFVETYFFNQIFVLLSHVQDVWYIMNKIFCGCNP